MALTYAEIAAKIAALGPKFVAFMTGAATDADIDLGDGGAAIPPLRKALAGIEAAGPDTVAAVEAAGDAEITAIEAAGASQIDLIITAALEKPFGTTGEALAWGVHDTASLVGGTGGTNGTFDLAFSGGTATRQASGRFVVAGGALTQILITDPGYYTAATAPTMSFAASGGLTGASATAVTAKNTHESEVFSTPGDDIATASIIYQVVSGVANKIAAVPPAGALQEVRRLWPGSDAIILIHGDAYLRIEPDRLFHPAIQALEVKAPQVVPGPPRLIVTDPDGAPLIDILQSDVVLLRASTNALAKTAALSAGAIQSTTDMFVIGDSLATDYMGFADELATLMPGRNMLSQAVGGQESPGIAVRLGVPTTVVVASNTIPAYGNDVVLSSFAANPFDASVPDPCAFTALVHDIPGVIWKAGSVVTFRRSSVGGAITTPNPANVKITSTYANNTTAAGTTALLAASQRLLIVRVGHNDIIKGVVRSDHAYIGRDALKAKFQAIYDAATPAAKHIIFCGITRGLGWLTQARVDAILGAGSGVTGSATSDAVTLQGIAEANAIEQWLQKQFPDFADLMGNCVTQGHVVSQDFGSGNVFNFCDTTWAPDGTHGSQGGVAQQADAALIKSIIDAKGY